MALRSPQGIQLKSQIKLAYFEERVTLPLPLLSSLNRKQEASLSVTMNFFSALVLTLAPWRPTTAFRPSSRELVLPLPAV